jgi:hypothetical protein
MLEGDEAQRQLPVPANITLKQPACQVGASGIRTAGIQSGKRIRV